MTHSAIKTIIAASLAGGICMTASPANASAVEFFKCTLEENATMSQLVAATKAMLKDAHANDHAGVGVYYLNPLYSSDISRGVFYWVGVAEDAGAIGAFNDYWESDANKKHRDKFVELSSGCESSSLHYGTEVKLDD
ncbi:MAG: hypothetical protein KDD85_02150 [Parvularculaceae bacterium]|nr:hypothetical protein [Parvularculaceae bacterium]